MKHTSTPWKEHDGFIIGKFSDGNVYDICDPRCAPSETTEIMAEMDANSALIVQAVNEHAALNAIAEAAKQMNDCGNYTERLHAALSTLATLRNERKTE
jgi:hypothetical protein